MTNSQPTSDEREERLANHMARLGAGLLLLKEKMEAPISRPVSYPDHVEFQFEGERYVVVSAQFDAATAMRDLCVEKVKEYLTDCRDEETGIIEAIASELQSLTLDQVQETDK